MTRAVYRCLVWLHPSTFRREFAGEMLWIFDEAAPTEGAAALLLDGFASLARQWFLRSGCWKILVALAGAAFQVTLGTALMYHIGPPPSQRLLSAAAPPDLVAVMRLAAFTAVGLLAAVFLLVLWWRKLSRRTGI